MPDRDERMKLCLRFLSCVLVEKEEYFDSVFIDNHESSYAQYIFGTFLDRNWIQEATGEAVKQCMWGYFNFFKPKHVYKYRKLDEHGNLSELVDAEIVRDYEEIRGVFDIEFKDTETQALVQKQTSIERLQPSCFN